MKIEHAALYVNDLEKARSFFVNYLGAESNDGYHNPRTGFRSYFLSFEGGARLEIMQRPGMRPRASGEHALGYTHLAFKVGSVEKVDQLTRELHENGCPLLNGPRMTGDGYYESVLTDPEGNLIELVA